LRRHFLRSLRSQPRALRFKLDLPMRAVRIHHRITASGKTDRVNLGYKVHFFSGYQIGQQLRFRPPIG
ncbi:MAG: hypothetical protein WAM12_04645, partial [Pseudolabrys sp.]